MEKVLLSTEEYAGKYVAFISPDENTIMGAGDTPEEALTQAKSKGYDSALLFHVPQKHSVHIY